MINFEKKHRDAFGELVKIAESESHNFKSKSLRLMSIEEIDFLKNAKIISSNDLSKGKRFEEVMAMPPGQFLNAYQDRISSLYDSFSIFDDLALRIMRKKESDKVLLSGAAEASISIDDEFKRSFRYTLSSKPYEENLAAKLEARLVDVPSPFITTPSFPSADLLVYFLLSTASVQYPDATSYLQKYVYLDERYTNREISRFKTSAPNYAGAGIEICYKMLNLYKEKQMFNLQSKELEILDDILKFDNFDERIIWSYGLHRIPMQYVYAWTQGKLMGDGSLAIEDYDPKRLYIDRMLDVFRRQ